jgi:hypothetical protein
MKHRWLALVALPLALAVAPAPASATHIACGDVITQDTTLDSDLACPGSGVLIGASDVTFDLNGHSVEGYVQSDTFTEFGFANYSNVTIENGTVRGLVRVAGDFNTVRDLQISGDLLLARPRECDERCPRLRAVGDVIERVVVSGGITFRSQDDFRVSRSVVSGGIVAEQSTGGLIDSNTARGIGLTLSREVTVTRNAVAVVQALPRPEPGLGRLSGIELYGTQSSRVGRNRVVGGRIAVGGLRSACLFELPAFSEDNLITRNIVSASSDDGIFVQGASRVGCSEPEDPFLPVTSGTVLIGNRTLDNADDGIDIDEPLTTVIKNRASGNADFGIEAVEGVNDGGKNRAFGNGNPLQCLNVRCK